MSSQGSPLVREEGQTTAKVFQPPSYDCVLLFLSSLAQWLTVARDRLTCRNEAAHHVIVVEVLSSYHERVYGPLEEFIWPRTPGVSEASTPLFPSASFKLTAWILLRVLFLVFTWRMLLRLARATTLPRLRARQIAWHLRTHISGLENTQAIQMLIWPDAAQRGINAMLLWSVGACSAVSCLLILGLLTMHIWVDVVLWHALQRWTASLWQAQEWVASWVGYPSHEPAREAGVSASLVDYVFSLYHVVSGWRVNFLPPLLGLREMMQHAKLMYLWGVVGSAVLGVALWLLSYSSRLLQSYNASLQYFEGNDPLLRWLAEQEAEATQQRADAAVVTLLEGQRLHGKMMEKLTNSLVPATNQDGQRSLPVSRGEGEQGPLLDGVTQAAATNDVNEDVQGDGDSLTSGAGAEVTMKACIASGPAGNVCEQFESLHQCSLITSSDEEPAAGAAGMEDQEAASGIGDTPHVCKNA